MINVALAVVGATMNAHAFVRTLGTIRATKIPHVHSDAGLTSRNPR